MQKLSPENYKIIEKNMLEDGQHFGLLSSFQKTIQRLERSIPGDEHMYGLAAKSAIPLADTIRGYHDELNLPEPEIVSVRADRSVVMASYDAQTQAITDEALRLQPHVENKNVIFLNQFVNSGRTLKIGHHMLKVAGAEHVRADLYIKWYEHTDHAEVDEENMTSKHADFMREIGQRAARLSLGRPAHPSGQLGLADNWVWQ